MIKLFKPSLASSLRKVTSFVDELRNGVEANSAEETELKLQIVEANNKIDDIQQESAQANRLIGLLNGTNN